MKQLLYTILTKDGFFPKRVLRCTHQNINIGDIIYAEVGAIKYDQLKKIYCKVE